MKDIGIPQLTYTPFALAKNTVSKRRHDLNWPMHNALASRFIQLKVRSQHSRRRCQAVNPVQHLSHVHELRTEHPNKATWRHNMPS
jgi:hypothetical protein